eukprot:jgi/Mesen1/4670/ME000241S03710
MALSRLACQQILAGSVFSPIDILNRRAQNVRPRQCISTVAGRTSKGAIPASNVHLKSSAHLRPTTFFGQNIQCAPLTLAVRKRVQKSPVAAAADAGDEAGKIVSEAASLPTAAEKAEASEMTKTIQLGSLFGLWYLFNIYFNIYNKQVLKVFPFPFTVTTIQFAIGGILVLTMWLTRLHKAPKVTKEQLIAIMPLALVHTLGNLFTNVSLGKVAVSFTHTIKALEPFFSVLLSSLVLGDKPTLPIILSLIPIVGGVGLASMTEPSFNWGGFIAAMASNLTFQSRNVLSKKLMVKKEGSLDNINLFSIITIMSFFLLSPVMLFGLDYKQVMIRTAIAGICFHAYQQVSYMILQRVTPVTHSVGNCVKRVIVIVTSVLFFRTPVSLINGLGTGVALAGVFGYSRVKAVKPKAA